MQKQALIIAALKTYRSKLTRYVLTNNPQDLEQAKSAVSWIKADMELNGKQYLKITNGLLNGSFEADCYICRQNKVDSFVINNRLVEL